MKCLRITKETKATVLGTSKVQVSYRASSQLTYQKIFGANISGRNSKSGVDAKENEFRDSSELQRDINRSEVAQPRAISTDVQNREKDGTMILELPTKGEAHFFVNMVANAVEAWR